MGLLDGKVTLVTGAGHGIGRAIAEAYLREGASVVAADVDEPSVAALVDNLDPGGARMVSAAVDVTSSASIRSLFDVAASRFDRLDVLVTNAGGGKQTAAMDVSEEEWDAMFAFNAKSAFLCCQAALKVMIPQRSGKIINMASAAGRALPRVGGVHYAASKAAVIGLTRVLAREVGPHGINVNAICPGIVGTERLVGILERSGRLASEAEVIPLRRLGTPEDIAGGAVFLASSMSDYITGAMLDVNGGVVMA